MTETIWDIMNQLTLPYEERVRLCRRIEQWHEGEVALLTGERDGARWAADRAIKERDIALEDNQRLRNEIDLVRKANADHQKRVEVLEAEVAILTSERNGVRMAWDIALEDNQRLREEVLADAPHGHSERCGAALDENGGVR